MDRLDSKDNPFIFSLTQADSSHPFHGIPYREGCNVEVDPMIRHYIVSAIRQIAKNKGVFAANVFGFTLNFIVVIFGLNYVLFEMSYDKFHEKGDRIYRVLVTDPRFR